MTRNRFLLAALPAAAMHALSGTAIARIINQSGIKLG
jgi:hypothetical protein